MKTLLLIAGVTIATVSAGLASDQTVGVQGQLMCGNVPLVGAQVKLWELDRWPNPDDMLAEVYTDQQGRFQVQGTDDDFPQINPVLKIYHRCNDKSRIFHLPGLCKRKNVYEIPSEYIVKGRYTDKYYNMGTVNLEAKMKGEGTECI